MVRKFLVELEKMRVVILERLLTTPLEILQRREYIEDVQNNTDKAAKATDQLTIEMTELALEAEQQVFFISLHPLPSLAWGPGKSWKNIIESRAFF